MKIVFLLSRYGTLIGQSLLALEELGILSHGSQKVTWLFCRYSHAQLECVTIVLYRFLVVPDSLCARCIGDNAE